MKPYATLYSVDPDTLRTEYGETILATYLVGSRAYGTATPKSDEDYRWIFVLPSRYYLSIREPVNQIVDWIIDTLLGTGTKGNPRPAGESSATAIKLPSVGN